MSLAAVASPPQSLKNLADRGLRLAIAAIALLVAVVIIRVAFGPQLDGLDDAGYLEAAQRVSRHQSLNDLFPLFRTRVGMAYPLGWLLERQWLEPIHFWWLTLIAESVTILSLCFAGFALSGSTSVGISAAALYAIYPLAVQQSMMYYPTSFQVASIALAMALIALAGRKSRTGQLVLGFVAGICLGLGYLVKEDVAIVVAAIVLAAMIVRFPAARIVAAVCAGAALIFAVESWMYWQSTGDPLFRLHATSGRGFVAQDDLRIGSIYHLDAYLRTLLLVPVEVGLFWWLAIAGLWAVIRGYWMRTVGRGEAFVAAVFLLVMAYLQFGSGSLSAYTPLPKTPRYTALATPPLMLITGWWLTQLVKDRRRLGLVVCALVISSAAACLSYLAVSSSERARNTIAILPVLDKVVSEPVYSDYYTVRLLRLLKPNMSDLRIWFHARFTEHRYVITDDPSQDPGAYVLLDRQMAKIYTSSYEMPLPSEIAGPKAQWEVMWQHRAYARESLTGRALDAIRSMTVRLPDAFPLKARVMRSVTEMADDDEATLYRVR